MPHIMIIMFPEPVKNGGFRANTKVKQVQQTSAPATVQQTAFNLLDKKSVLLIHCGQQFACALTTHWRRLVDFNEVPGISKHWDRIFSEVAL